MLRQIKPFASFLFTVLLFGCLPARSDLTLSPTKMGATATATLPQRSTATWKPSISTANVDETSAPLPQNLINVVSGRILDFWWSTDSVTLYFALPDSIWAYDLATGTTRPATLGEAITETPQLETIGPIPENAVHLDISPSGDSAIYLTPLGPTPTVPPTTSVSDSGEIWLGGGLADVWILEKGVSKRIGQLENCVDSYIWARDEQRVVILRAPLSAPCKSPPAWLANVRQNTVQPLWIQQNNSSEYAIYGLSPDGQNLLFRWGDHLFVLDLDTLDVVKLDTPFTSGRGQWVNDQTLMFVYTIETRTPWISTFDMQTSVLTRLIDPDRNTVLAGLSVFLEKISPDGGRLAFVTGTNFYNRDNLWLIKLDESN